LDLPEVSWREFTLTDELKQAITLIRSGNKAGGGQILAQILKTDPKNEPAWLWMSQTVKTRQQQQDCLEKVLAINPNNMAAQKALAQVKQTSPSATDPYAFKNKSAFQTRPQHTPPTTGAVRKPQIQSKKRPPMSSAEITRILIFAGGFALILVLVVAAGIFVNQNRQFEEEFTPMIGVCQRSRVREAADYSRKAKTHPAVGVVSGSDGLELDNYYIPRSVRAESIAETELVLCLGKPQDVFIESCPYYDPDHPGVKKKVERYYYKQEARLIVAKTGQVISKQTFTGKSARYCRETEYFSEDEYVIKLKGTSISSADIGNWARSQLIVE